MRRDIVGSTWSHWFVMYSVTEKIATAFGIKGTLLIPNRVDLNGNVEYMAISLPIVAWHKWNLTLLI